MHGNRRRIVAGGGLGAIAGVVIGVMLAAGASGAGASGRVAGPPSVEATHLPPLLTAAGEAVTLRYDVYCVGSDDPTAPCIPAGTVWVRAGDSGSFQALPLTAEPGVAGRLSVRVAAALVRSGFSYYAVLRDIRTGASTMVPSAGAAAPERSLPLGTPAVVDLGEHGFGATRRADARVASATWGDGPARVGLEDSGPDATPIGASSFDVDASGRVSVLDEAHHRLLRWSGGSAPRVVPISIDGTIADLAVGADGSSYVLETTGARVVRVFDASGKQTATAPGGQAASALRLGSRGPVVLESGSAQWSSPAAPGGARPEVGLPLPAGSHVVTYEPSANEVRLALVSGSTVTRSWRILSSTPLAEVQLAQPLGQGLLVVVRTYAGSQVEFVALVLGQSGLVRQFSMPAADWAETAPLARFRLVGSALYQLGSTSGGIFVDRFDLGVS
jgi:hypothetical protein